MHDSWAWEAAQGLFLTTALVHIAITSIVFLVAIAFALRQSFRPIPILAASAIAAHTIWFFAVVFSNLSIADLFTSLRWPRDFLLQRWPLLFMIEPLVLIFAIWFQLACCIDASRFHPSTAEVARFRDQYESTKGHRDFVIIYCLFGDESQEDTLASIRSAIESRFPTHRLRIVLLFYGPSCSVLDRFLRSHLSSEPLDQSVDDGVTENIVAVNGVKVN